MFSIWPTIEIGVGLIACNLPSLSFRIARALPEAVRIGWNVSLSGLRYALGRLSTRSESRRTLDNSHHGTVSDGTVNDDAAASSWYGSRDSTFENASEAHSAKSITHIPLVHLGSKACAGTKTSSVDDRVDLESGKLNNSTQDQML